MSFGVTGQEECLLAREAEDLVLGPGIFLTL